MNKEELIPGYWYTGDSGNNIWLFKFLELRDGEVQSTHSCTPADNYYHSKSDPLRVSSGEKKNYKEATEAEVKKMWPKEKYTNQSFPEEWCIKPCDELRKWMRAYDKTKPALEIINVAFTHLSNYYYLHKNNNLRLWSYSSVLPIGYTEITFEQFEKHILKINKPMENKTKLTGYKCIKTYPEHPLGELIDTTGKRLPGACISSVEKPGSYPEYWEPIYERELEVGDIVTTTGKWSSQYPVGYIFKITKLTSSAGVAYAHNGVSIDNNGSSHNIETYKCRLATPAEVKVYEEIFKIKLANYEAEYSKGYVKFGCKKLTTEDLKAVLRVQKLVNELGPLGFTSTSTLKANTWEISVDKIKEILTKIE